MKRTYLFLMLFLVLTMSMFAQTDETGMVMPSMTALVATVAIVTQFIKKGINNSNFGFLKKIIIEKWGAVVLAVLVSIGTVAYFALNTGTPFNVGLLMLMGQVAIATTMGYSILKAGKKVAE